MRLTLVHPPWQFRSLAKLYPLGVAYIASCLRHSGFSDVDILDLNLKISDPKNVFKESIKSLEKRKSDVIGLSCWTVHFPFFVEFVKMYKEKHPDAKVILGGVHPSCHPEQTMRLCPADIIVRGEGEETMVELISALEKGEQIKKIPGITYRDGEELKNTPDRPLIKNLDHIPFPAYDLLPKMEEYQPLNRKHTLSILASRGCPYRCIFCSSSRLWAFQRRRSPENVIDEIKWLMEKYELGCLRFEDDTLTIKRSWAAELFKKMQDLSIFWECRTRIDNVDHELLNIMKSSGCTTIYHGVESASPRLWKVLRKGFPEWVTVNYIKKLVRKEVRLNLNPVISSMVGIPTETEKEMRSTINLMSELRRLGADVQIWIMTPYPDTDAVKLYEDKLIKIDRWRRLRQWDVFSPVSREAYQNLIDKYSDFIPDNWMFKNEIRDMEEFITLYFGGVEFTLGDIMFV